MEYTRHFTKILENTQNKRLNTKKGMFGAKYMVCKHDVGIVESIDDCEDCFEEALRRFWSHDYM